MDPGADLLRCARVAELLAAWMARQRAADPGFSGRAFAREVGEPNQTIVHSVAMGGRRLTLTQLARWLPAMNLSPPEQEHLLALVRREEADAELRRQRARSGSNPSEEARARLALQELDLQRAEAALAALLPGSSAPALRARPEPSVLARIDGERALDPERALALSGERGTCMERLETSSGAAPPPLFGLTEAVSGDQIARLRAELRRAGEEILATRDDGPTWTLQLGLFSLSRAIDAEMDAGAVTPNPPGQGAPPLLDWVAPEAGGARGWLAAWLRWRQAGDPRFTHASFARLCGQTDRAILWKILRGRQGLTPGRARAFARGIGLDEDEEELLALLADRDRGESPEARALLQPAIDRRAAQLGASVLTLRRARLLSGWAPYAIHELAACAGFQADPRWIAHALDGRVTPAEVERALDMLFSARMLASLPAGLRPVAERWQLDRPAHATRPEDAVLRYHQAMAEQERQALQRWASGVRDPNLWLESLRVTLRAEALQTRLQSLFERLQGLCAGGETRTQVVQICMHGWEDTDELRLGR